MYNNLMKIAIFIKSTTHHRNYGGMETQNKVLCDELALRGYQVTVFSPQRELTIKEKFENGVKYEFVPCDYENSIFASVNRNSWFNRSFEAFKKADNDKKFDVVITQSSAGLGIIKKKKSIGVGIISISHGTTVSEFKSYLGSIHDLRGYAKLIPNIFYTLRNFFGRQREFIHGADVNIAVSNYVKSNLISETFVDESKITVISNGVDPRPFEQFTRTYKSTKNLKLMYLGRIDRTKGVFQLLRLAKKFPEIQVNFYGIGDAFDELSKLILKSNINNVVLHGKVLYKDVVKKYFENDVFVLPTTRIEGLPMTLIEAQFSKMPIVASDIGGITDAVKNGRTGLLVDAGDFEDLADKIKILMNSMDTRKKVSEGAYAFAMENFTITKMVDKYEQVIRRLRR